MRIYPLSATHWPSYEPSVKLPFSLDSQKYSPQQVHKMSRAFLTLNQSPAQSVSEYLERFKDKVDLIDECGGFIGFNQAMIQVMLIKGEPPVDTIPSTPDQ